MQGTFLSYATSFGQSVKPSLYVGVRLADIGHPDSHGQVSLLHLVHTEVVAALGPVYTTEGLSSLQS